MSSTVDYKLPSYKASKAHFDIAFSANSEKAKIKELSLLILKPEISKKIQAEKTNDSDIKYLFKEMSKPGIAGKVFSNLEKATTHAIKKEQEAEKPDKQTIKELQQTVEFIDILKSTIIPKEQNSKSSSISFKGNSEDNDDVIDKIGDFAEKHGHKLGVVHS